MAGIPRQSSCPAAQDLSSGRVPTLARDESLNSRGDRATAPFVTVAIRVKPHAPHETAVAWAKPDVDDASRCSRVVCNRGYSLEEHSFSRVFGAKDTNANVFDDLHGAALTASVFSGVNETLFAYGQTGTGKTHTIFGTEHEAGLLQHFVRSVFEHAEVWPGSSIHVCCYEVLGDTLTDLINPEPFIEFGELRDDDVAVDELFLKTQKYRYRIVRVACAQTCLDLLQDARMNRSSGVSSCNAKSSRSHAVVHMFVQNPTSTVNSTASLNSGVGSGGYCVSSTLGALTLVDLAGAEKEHENPTEHGRKSARILNTSLSSLNRLLRKLQTNGLDESERRQSVLNKCLWEYLCPGCGIALVFCVSPLLKHRVMTLSTLAMATDSKLIHSRRRSQLIQMPMQAPQPQPSLRGSRGHSAEPSPRAGGGGGGGDRTPRSSTTAGGSSTHSPCSGGTGTASERRHNSGGSAQRARSVPSGAGQHRSGAAWLGEAGGACASSSAAYRSPHELPTASISLAPSDPQEEIAKLLLTIDELRARLEQLPAVAAEVGPGALEVVDLALRKVDLKDLSRKNLAGHKLKGVFERLHTDAIQRIQRHHHYQDHVARGQNMYSPAMHAAAYDPEDGELPDLERFHATAQAALCGMWYHTDHMFRSLTQYAGNKGGGGGGRGRAWC